MQRTIGLGSTILVLTACAVLAGVSRASDGQTNGPVDLSIARDGGTRFFSFDPEVGQLTLGAVDRENQIELGKPFGPYDGWTPIASAEGGDGLTRILWRHEDGAAALWLVASFSVSASFRLPVIPRYSPLDVAGGVGSVTHILWTASDGSALLQAVGAAGEVQSSLTLGPYGGWSPTAIADGSDGLTRILWNNSDERVGLSLASSGGIVATRRYTVSEGWKALDIAGGDFATQVLFSFQDGQTTYWRVLSADVGSGGFQYSQVLTALPGLEPRRIALDAAGSARILFRGSFGAALVRLSSGALFEGWLNLTPVSGTGIDISGDWLGLFTTNDSADCSSDLSATATLLQSDSQVTGSISTGDVCGFGGLLSGQISKGQMTGTLTKGRYGPSTVFGSVSSTQIHLNVKDLRNGSELIPGGILDLHR